MLATYGEDFYAGMPALTVNRYGKGKAYYMAFRGEKSFTDKITEKLLDECGITSDFDGELPYGMTAHSRTDGENIYVFLQNYSTKPLTTNTKHNWITADDKQEISGEITLASYETLILARKA